VIDPFQGSGTTGIAAFKEGRQFIGIELEESYIKTSLKRFKDEFQSFHHDKEKGKS
jgi:site-specific DNA-methyltransferase (adenine-specific)